MRRFLSRLRRDDSGATAIEYGLILSLMFLVILGALNAFGATGSGDACCPASGSDNQGAIDPRIATSRSIRRRSSWATFTGVAGSQPDVRSAGGRPK